MKKCGYTADDFIEVMKEIYTDLFEMVKDMVNVMQQVNEDELKKFAAELIAEFLEWEESLANLPYDGKSMVRQGSRRIQNAANRFYEKAE